MTHELDDRFARHLNYSADLQRIIEDLCRGGPIREPKTSARFHYDMAVAYLSAAKSEPVAAPALEPVAWEWLSATGWQRGKDDADLAMRELDGRQIRFLYTSTPAAVKIKPLDELFERWKSGYGFDADSNEDIDLYERIRSAIEEPS